MTGPDCVVMCNLINTHTHTTRMTGPDCVVMCNLINTHTHTCHVLETRQLADEKKIRQLLNTGNSTTDTD